MSSWYGVNANSDPGLTLAQRQNNAMIITGFFRDLGWTDNAIAGMLGNMDVESYLNPGQFQNGYPMTYESQGGFGLVQWTPVSKFASWAGQYWQSDYNRQLYRIRAEWQGIYQQWVPRAGYTMTFMEYSRSTDTPASLAMAFFWCYEYGTPLESQRTAAANYWYEYITGTPAPPLPPDPVYTSLPKWLFCKIVLTNRRDSNGRPDLL